jgi:dehydrogenase/reductase SDR family member 4
MQRNGVRFDILSAGPACQLSHTKFHIVESDLFSLKGKVALVTGSTRGIGKAIAEALGRAGAKVSLSSRKAEACESTRTELAAKGLEVIAQPCNVSRKFDLEALVDATRAQWGGIDIVVK